MSESEPQLPPSFALEFRAQHHEVLTTDPERRAGQKGHFAKLDEKLQRDYGWSSGALGRFLLFAQWEELYAAEDPFGAHYFPVSAYLEARGLEGEVLEDGWTVGLKAVAVEHVKLQRAMAKGAGS